MRNNNKPGLVIIAFLAAVALFVLHSKVEGAVLEVVNVGATIQTFMDAEPVTVEQTDEVITASAPTAEQIAEEEYWDSLELIALTVEAEAGNQDLYGKRLVADVILNRVDSPEFPDTVYEVISQIRQFATYSNGAIDAAGWHMQEDDYTAVLMEIEHRTDPDILYFTAGGYNPSGTPAYRYGDHYFSK
jgi:N-acetylmuramoyl-L-alanine amidase